MGIITLASKAWVIKNCVEKQMFHEYDFSAQEITPYKSRNRFDVVGFRKSNHAIDIVEVKSGRSDFETDKKWMSYLKYANYFYFATPCGVISEDELPDGVGLIEFYDIETSPRWYIRKNAKRNNSVRQSDYILLLESLLFRVKDKTR